MAENEQIRRIPAFVAFVAGGLLTALVWRLSDSSREQDPSPDAIHSASRAELVPPRTVAASCPPAPPCPSVECQPSIVTVTRGRVDDADPIDLEVVERVQASLSEVMREVGVSVSFDLDCTTHPCLAVFADPIPSMEDRAVIADRLVESRPGGNLISSTIISKDHRVSWVLVLADAELTEADEVSVRARVDELLLR